ncbi:MAG: enoyl-CoA hydratase/isomerase family protein [Burkholderiaceae bacterium]|nr:enoyl-CoA hydratase/isomerase family protein [Burkholderiaceae bacterium]
MTMEHDMDAQEPIVLIRTADVLEIVLNRPAEGNRITEEMGQILVDALSDTASGHKVVLLRASGDDFCLGRQSPKIDRARATAQEFRRVIAEGPLRLYGAMRESRAPIVGLLQGRAHGVGCAVAALCDLTIAADDVRFLVPELDAGIPPTLVISALAGRVPYRIVQELVYLREEMSAVDGRSFGLVNRIVPRGELEAEGRRVIDKLAKSSAASLAAVKEFAIAACASSPAVNTSLAATLISNVLSSNAR